MAFYAKKFNQDEEKWRITGLLHDFDWEIHPTAEEHPALGAAILRENNVSEEIIHAILSHSNTIGIKPSQSYWIKVFTHVMKLPV